MNRPVKQYSLLAVTIALGLTAIAIVVWWPPSANGQINALRRWNPSEFWLARFIGDQACAGVP